MNPSNRSLTTYADAKVTKRPLLRPAIPSPHAGASHQKIVYISSSTPFMSAVKRVEKLLRLADKRAVQAATTNAKQQGPHKGGKRKRGADGDENLGIAEEMERVKRDKRRQGGGMNGGEETVDGVGEEVVLKGTGKAIHRVLELALWFQQREQEYVVRLRTGSVGAIDDISVGEDGTGAGAQDPGVEAEHAEAGAENKDAMDVDDAAGAAGLSITEPRSRPEDDEAKGGKKGSKKKESGKAVLAVEEVPETRIRYANVLEAAVSLR